MQNIGTLTRGNGIKRTEIVNQGQGCIRYGEIYTFYDTFCFTPRSHINNDVFNKSLKISKNDILMTLTGENKIDIAKAIAYLGEDLIACGSDLTVLSNHKCNPLYLVYLLNSPYGIHCKHDLSSGDIIVHISNEKLSSILMPIPPIREQNKIVEKIRMLNNIIQ